MIPTDPDVLLSRKATAEALSEAGYPMAWTTLETMACRGGGPPYRRYGKSTLYRWGDALSWAQNKAGAPRCTAAEHAQSKAR